MSSLGDADSSLEERKPPHLWNTVMFFPDHFAHRPDSTTQQFLWYFAQAKFAIRACIYHFSFPELEYVIFQQCRRGLIVEFIVGDSESENKLRKIGVQCGNLSPNPNKSDFKKLMHHKFALIDDEAVLTGSLNWATQSILENKENVCVSTDPNHVKPFLDEFFKLRKICEDAKTFH